MRIVLLRPPRYIWPFNSGSSAFWPPLGLLCLAAVVRERLPKVDIEVWDAPAERMGWQSLQRRLVETQIDVLGVGEETVSAHEALRAAKLVKEFHPECLVVAGGVYFSYAVEQTLERRSIDIIVRGEGEETFVELVQHLVQRSPWHDIEGISFLDNNGKVISNPPRSLIDDLDSLPFPAYDKVNLNRYGHNSRNHAHLVSIEHSRGCIDSCAFCILWRHMGAHSNGSNTVKPYWRSKSPERSFTEVKRLYSQFGRRTFGWSDPTFNAYPEWSDGWSDLMLRSSLVDRKGPSTTHTAWLRADGVVRDERLGVLGKLVRAGLRQVMIGIERDDERGLALLNKHHNSLDICREAFAIFRERYPQVYTIGSMIFGLPGDTMADLKRLAACQYKIGADYCFMIPLTPNPGAVLTDHHDDVNPALEEDWARYNFHTPLCDTGVLRPRDLEGIYWRIAFGTAPGRLTRMLQFMLRERDARKRRVHWALLRKGTHIAVSSMAKAIFDRRNPLPTLYSRRPSWYEK